MLRFLADENFNNDILRGLWRRSPLLDIVRVQDVEVAGVGDPEILEWAANQQRVVLTHDETTMAAFAYERVQKGLPMPGLVEVRRTVPVRAAIEDLLLLAECSTPNEWEGQVIYLPMR